MFFFLIFVGETKSLIHYILNHMGEKEKEIVIQRNADPTSLNSKPLACTLKLFTKVVNATM
jgi:hypothetical protein